MQGRWQLREGQVAPLSFVVPVEGRPLVRERSVTFESMTAPHTTLALALLGETQCTLRVGITAKGDVDGVTVAEGCPDPLRIGLESAALTWEAEPWLVDGVAVPILADVVYLANPDGVPVLQHSEVEVKRRTMPVYPDAARRLYPPGTAVDCPVRVFIDMTGTPYLIRPEAECPGAFRDSAHDAMMNWRWYPVKIEEQAVKGQFVIIVKYRLD